MLKGPYSRGHLSLPISIPRLYGLRQIQMTYQGSIHSKERINFFLMNRAPERKLPWGEHRSVSFIFASVQR